MEFRFFDGTDINDVLSELNDPVKYRGYLQAMSRFSGYSWRNILMIYKQMPHASKLADFDTWKKQYGRKLKQGSKSIKIYVPAPQKPKASFIEKTDPVTGVAVLDGNGKKIMEKVFVEAPVQFKQASFFDISQTEGNPVPRLAGDVITDEALRGVFADVLKAMASSFDDNNDYYEKIRQICLERLENKDDFIIDSVVCAVCFRFGVNVGNISFDIRNDAETLEAIVKQADGLIADIEDRFAVLCRERGLDPMTAYSPAEPKLSVEPEVVLATEPQYIKELRTETVAEVEFEQYVIKPITAEETPETTIITENSAPPLSAAREPEDIPQTETPPPQLPPVKQPKHKEPFVPPLLKHPPDPSITIAERNEYGYTRPELLPLTKNRAVILFMRDMTIYLLHKNNTETMARYLSDIQNHDGIFGVAYGAWINTREYIALASGKPEDRLEAKFIFDGGDAFAIYQTEPDGSPTAYKSYEELEKHGLDINRHNYNLVYIAPLPAPPSDNPAGLFMWVNAERPEDYNGRALSISDVLSIKKDELITSYYTNGRTFKELLSFMGEEGRKYRRRLEIEAAESAIAAAQNAVQDKQETQPSVPVLNTQDNAVFSSVPETPQPQTQAEPPISPPITAAIPLLTDTPIKTTELSQTEEPAAENPEAQTTTKPSPPALPEIRSEVPVYRFPAKQAELSGALEAYDFSRRADIECAETIDRAIKAHKKGDDSYNLKTPAERLIRRYGKERMKWVLAKHIQAAQTGFSDDNVSWANVFLNVEPGSGDVPPAFTINAHHAVLEAFINEARVILDQKPTFNELMKTAKRKSDAHNKSGNQ